MGDLIDREALGVGPANPEVFVNPAYADGWNALLKIIKQAPVIDAAPVVHGRWLYHPDDLFPAEGKQECSRCHAEETMYICNEKYCPNCGAKMDGEGNAE